MWVVCGLAQIGESGVAGTLVSFKGSWFGSSARKTWKDLGRDFTVAWASRAGVNPSAQHNCEVGRINYSDGSCRLVYSGSLPSLGKEAWPTPLLYCISPYGSWMMGKGHELMGREGVPRV